MFIDRPSFNQTNYEFQSSSWKVATFTTPFIKAFIWTVDRAVASSNRSTSLKIGLSTNFEYKKTFKGAEQADCFELNLKICVLLSLNCHSISSLKNHKTLVSVSLDKLLLLTPEISGSNPGRSISPLRSFFIFLIMLLK